MKFIKDSEFIRGKCPMTKEDIRILTISKLDLDKDSNFLDIGSGTGSITIQASKFIEEGAVFSIERDEEAIRATKENLKKFNCNNVTLLEGDAIEHMESLSKEIKKEKISKFDSIFIGGSGGGLEKIINISDEILKEHGVLVLNFITLNNAYNAIEFLKKLEYKTEISLVNISKNRENTYMMISNNPIFIVKAFKEEN
ncbi:precorrin-6Y C5,15-methyltransferase (decarboxylating) subunit CbiT [Clostridium perfringens]|nr:precorrin-6Y C5,15-methyltransferase (decarboxylating) subunit CbiT [Clostridium perfringens]